MPPSSLPPAAAPSSSYSLPLARPLAAGSETHQIPTTWVILGRVLVTDFVAEAEDEVAGAEEHAHHAAVDFTFPLAPPPRVTIVSAGRSAHPDPSNPDGWPYIISATPYCILAHFAGVPSTSHLVAIRHFRTAEGQTTAAAAMRVPDRTAYAPTLMNVASVVVCSNNSEYTIFELQVHRWDSSARLIRIRSGWDNWDSEDIRCPLPAGDRVWVPHGAVSDHHQNLFWYDLSWGILSYDASITGRDAKLHFQSLPDDRALGESTPGIHTSRCIAMSRDELRYVEMIPEGNTATVRMWTRSRVLDEWEWQRTYAMSLNQIWDDHSYEKTKLSRDMPVFAIVCPLDPEVIYFALEQHLFGVNVSGHRVVNCEHYELAGMPRPPPPASNRYVIPWHLPPEVMQALKPVGASPFPLPTELVGVIADLLLCPVARMFLTMVCRDWRAETRLLKPLPHRLPGLLFPYHCLRALSEADSSGSLVCLVCCTDHPVRRLALLDGSRFIGSYEGGWAFTAYGQDRYHMLVNMNTGGEPIPLPDEMRINRWLRLRIIIRAATLSAPPETRECIGGAIVSASWPGSGKPNEHVVFWRMGSRIVSCAKEMIADDIVFIDDSFYVLLNNGDITVCTPEVDEYLSLNQLEVKTKDLELNFIDDSEDAYLPTSRYLVQWQGDLLMVVRRRRPSGPIVSPMTTCSFQLFQMTKCQKQEHDEYSWDRIMTLDGLIITLGRGCSKCFNAASFAGVQPGIYFHDEDFHRTEIIWNEKPREYPCSDNGVCWELPDCGQASNADLIPSQYSSPIWFLH